MANKAQTIHNSLAFRLLGTPPSDPKLGEMYQDLNGKPFRWNGSSWIDIGSGSGGINYITNGDAEGGTTGWSTYADAAASRPVDGTGGSANVTWSTSLSNPLRGDSSFLFTKDAVNRQGQGVSYDFTIDAADQAKVINISFDYSLVSGTYSGGDSTTDSDIIAYIYRTTATGRLIEPTPINLSGAVIGQFYTYKGSFQADHDATGYRIIFHVATTSASAYVMKIDNIVVGPQIAASEGRVITAFAYMSAGTFSGGAGTIVPLDSVHYDTGGNWDTATYEFVVSEAGYYDISGGSEANSSTVSIYLQKNGAAITSPTPFRYLNDMSSSDNNYRQTFSNQDYFVKGDRISIACAGNITNNTYMIVTKRASVNESSDGRVVSAAIGLTSNYAAGSLAPIIYDTVHRDSHGAYNVSTGGYRVPIAGDYRLSVVTATTASAGTLYVKKNSTDISYITYTENTSIRSGSVIVPNCKAGDILYVYTDTALTFFGATPNHQNYLSIDKLAGPSEAQAGEKIISSVYLAGSYVHPGSGSPVQYDTIRKDTHGMYNTSTYEWTVPVAGDYMMTGSILSQSVTAGGLRAVNITQGIQIYVQNLASVAVNDTWSGSALIPNCIAGDILRFELDPGSINIGNGVPSYSSASVYKV